MGLFDFFKNSISKSNSDKLEYEDKPYEWFLSNEGKQSFLKYANNWRDMDAYMADMVDVGKWDSESSSAKLIREITNISVDPKHYKPSERQKLWPCHYLINFLKAYALKYKNDKSNQLTYLRINNYISLLDETGYYLYFLSLMVPEDINNIKWPDFLTPEGNPLIYYLINRYVGSMYPKHKNANVIYIHDLNEQGIDASKESWLYDENIYWNKSIQSMRTPDAVDRAILEAVAYPDIYRRILRI